MHKLLYKFVYFFLAHINVFFDFIYKQEIIMEQKWVEWAKKIQAIAQNGLTFADDKYDIERYQQMREIAAEIFSQYSNYSFQEIHDFINKENGYATPKVDVRGVIFEEDRILLVKESIDKCWTLPGGWADVCETPSGNVQREVFEEAGLEVTADRLLAVYDRSKQGHIPEYPFHVYKMFFLCKVTGGEMKPGMETLDVGFFDLDNLPELSLGRVNERQLKRMLQLRNLQITDFD